LVVGGCAVSETTGRDLKSLLVSYYQDGQLIFAGRVGTGFSLKAGRELMAQLRKHGRSDPPFVSVPREYRRGVELGRASVGGRGQVHDMDPRRASPASFL
jgi:bifunctional non-homologous end joining protein LigD